MGNKMGRRNFMKISALAAEVSLAQGAPYERPPSKEADDILKGVCDIHVHASPDTKERSIDEFGFAYEAKGAGYRAVMFKSNYWSCHDRAYLIRRAVADFECFGSLCMNGCVGDRVNARAAELAASAAGGLCKCIWMPTLDSAYQNEAEGRRGKGIPVLDASSRVLPEVVKVMEICARADIIFATGHSSPRESLILAKKAREIGVKKFVVTHANSTIWKMTPDQIRQAADLGAFIEFCYLPCLWGKGTGLPMFERMPESEFASFVKIIPQRSFVSTDLGQVGIPRPIDGMRMCITSMLDSGISKETVDLLVRKNPAELLGLQPKALSTEQKGMRI